MHPQMSVYCDHTTIIVDIGTETTKIGYSNFDTPFVFERTSSEQNFFSSPLKFGKIDNITNYCETLSHNMSKLSIKNLQQDTCSLIVCIKNDDKTYNIHKKNREKILHYIFGKNSKNIPINSIFFANSYVCDLFGFGRTTGIVVSLSGMISVVSVLDGLIAEQYDLGYGSLDLTYQFRNLFEKEIDFLVEKCYCHKNNAEKGFLKNELAREIKEEFLYLYQTNQEKDFYEMYLQKGKFSKKEQCGLYSIDSKQKTNNVELKKDETLEDHKINKKSKENKEKMHENLKKEILLTQNPSIVSDTNATKNLKSMENNDKSHKLCYQNDNYEMKRTSSDHINEINNDNYHLENNSSIDKIRNEADSSSSEKKKTEDLQLNDFKTNYLLTIEKIELEKMVYKITTDVVIYICELIEKSDQDRRSALLNNIVVTGGMSNSTIFVDRIIQKLTEIYTQSKFKVFSEKGVFHTYFGASILGSLGNAKQLFISNDDYEHYGGSIVDKKRFLWTLS